MQDYHAETIDATAAEIAAHVRPCEPTAQLEPLPDPEWKSGPTDDDFEGEPYGPSDPEWDEFGPIQWPAPAEPEPTGHDAADETWWTAFCSEREAVLDRMLALQPVELTAEDWDAYGRVRLEDDRVNGYWAGLDERGDR